MHRPSIFPFLAAFFCFSPLSYGAELVSPNEHLKLNPWTGEGFNLGGVLFPRVSYQAAAGSSTTDPASLATGHHDPDRHGITQQDIEFAATAKFGKHLRLAGIYAAKIDQDDHWRGEFEEYYAELVGLPLDSTIKGGRFYTKFGYDNSDHPHAYTFVDKFLAPGRLIGEDSATIYGGQISLPVLGRVLPIGWSDRLSFSFGAAPEAEEHEHEHGEEQEEPTYEGERAAWTDNLATLDYTLSYSPRKAVSYQAGVSAAWGENDFDRQTQLYGAHVQYLWRPSGAVIPDSGHDDIEKGEFFRWRTEVYVRHFGAEGTEEEEYKDSVVVPGIPTQFRTEYRIKRFFNAGIIYLFPYAVQVPTRPGIRPTSSPRPALASAPSVMISPTPVSIPRSPTAFRTDTSRRTCVPNTSAAWPKQVCRNAIAFRQPSRCDQAPHCPSISSSNTTMIIFRLSETSIACGRSSIWPGVTLVPTHTESDSSPAAILAD